MRRMFLAVATVGALLLAGCAEASDAESDAAYTDDAAERTCLLWVHRDVGDLPLDEQVELVFDESLNSEDAGLTTAAAYAYNGLTDDNPDDYARGAAQLDAICDG